MGARNRTAPVRRSGTAAGLVLLVLAGFSVTMPLLGCLNPGSRNAQVPSSETKVHDWVILLDLSKSTQDYRTEYVGGLKRLAEQFEPGDHFLVYDIADASEMNSHEITSGVIPVANLDSMPSELYREAEKRRAEEQLVVRRDAIVQTVAAVVEGENGSGNDIIGGLNLALAQFQNSGITERRIVIFSDMQHGGKGVDLRRPGFNRKALLDKLGQKQAVPDLSGVWVVAVGARGQDGEHWEEVRSFWTELVEASGGKLDYHRELSSDLAARL